MTEQEISDGKTTAILSYLTIIGTLIAYFMNVEKKNRFAGFHLRQALGLWLTYAVIGLLVSQFDSWFASIGFYIFFAVLFIYGFGNAISGIAQTVPILGEYYQKWFSSFGS